MRLCFSIGESHPARTAVCKKVSYLQRTQAIYKKTEPCVRKSCLAIYLSIYHHLPNYWDTSIGYLASTSSHSRLHNVSYHLMHITIHLESLGLDVD